MKNSHKYLLILTSTCLMAPSCNGGTARLIDNGFIKYLEDKAGYTATAMPSTLESGASLVYVKNEEGKKKIEWVGDLLSCGMPESIVFGELEEMREKTRNAKFPDFAVSSKNDFGLGATLSIKGVGANAKLSVVRKTIFTVDSSGHEVIQRLAVANYLADPLKRRNMKDYCVDAVESQTVAVLVDVAYIENGKVEFFKDDGLEIKLTKAEITDVLDLDAGANAKTDTNGTMTIDQRTYVAFKEAYYVPDSGTLAGGPSDLRDASPDIIDALGSE